VDGASKFHRTKQAAPSKEDASGPSAAPRGRAAKAASAAATSTGKERRRQVLLSAADALLACAVDGGAAAAAAASSLPSQGGDGPDQPRPPGYGPQPPTPQDLALWLRLAAKAFAAAGCHLEAGRLYHALGQTDAARSQFRRCAGREGLADVYEKMAEAELQRTTQGAGAAFGGAAAAGLPRMGGGFLAAGRLLKEAWLARYEEVRSPCRLTSV
jgi:hypothetical protein